VSAGGVAPSPGMNTRCAGAVMPTTYTGAVLPANRRAPGQRCVLGVGESYLDVFSALATPIAERIRD